MRLFPPVRVPCLARETGKEEEMLANSRDFCAGLFFIAVGVAVFVIARNYGIGSLAHLGPGFFPMLLGALLVALGLAIGGVALRERGAARISLSWRPLIIISMAVAIFALGLDALGLFLAVALLVTVSRLARPGESWIESGVLALGSAAVASVLFWYVLGLPVPLWPALVG